MITAESTLADVCFAVAGALEANGAPGVLTGGSAAAIYAPESLTSYDADFVLVSDVALDVVAEAVAAIGFKRQGRSRFFAHPDSHFTLDFPKGPLAVGGDYVRKTHVLVNGDRRLRILARTDCIRDRLAHYYFWDDFTALNAAVAVAAGDRAAHADTIDFLRAWTERESPALLEKFSEFERRLARARLNVG